MFVGFLDISWLKSVMSGGGSHAEFRWKWFLMEMDLNFNGNGSMEVVCLYTIILHSFCGQHLQHSHLEQHLWHSHLEFPLSITFNLHSQVNNAFLKFQYNRYKYRDNKIMPTSIAVYIIWATVWQYTTSDSRLCNCKGNCYVELNQI